MTVLSYPPLSEMIVDVYVDRGSDDAEDTTVIIEPDPDVQERMGLGIARCLVNMSRIIQQLALE